jgi:hypothetical protein
MHLEENWHSVVATFRFEYFAARLDQAIRQLTTQARAMVNYQGAFLG